MESAKKELKETLYDSSHVSTSYSRVGYLHDGLNVYSGCIPCNKKVRKNWFGWKKSLKDVFYNNKVRIKMGEKNLVHPTVYQWNYDLKIEDISYLTCKKCQSEMYNHIFLQRSKFSQFVFKKNQSKLTIQLEDKGDSKWWRFLNVDGWKLHSVASFKKKKHLENVEKEETEKLQELIDSETMKLKNILNAVDDLQNRVNDWKINQTEKINGAKQQLFELSNKKAQYDNEQPIVVNAKKIEDQINDFQLVIASSFLTKEDLLKKLKGFQLQLQDLKNSWSKIDWILSKHFVKRQTMDQVIQELKSHCNISGKENDIPVRMQNQINELSTRFNLVQQAIQDMDSFIDTESQDILSKLEKLKLIVDVQISSSQQAQQVCTNLITTTQEAIDLI